MNDFSKEKWESIKTLAARIQAIKSLLKVFDEQVISRPFAPEFNFIRKHLEADFNQTLDALLKLTEEDDELDNSSN
ncbi:hypothetical protein H6F78_00220 [Coleofasciculus sp. FACHB-64]|uniref:hypothetical protein n=1 Tax=Cyanophyceae TaxID=3028117 RepID=UPI001685583D|nr:MULTISPECIES: hypothetical protein [unclassified Coleofasciculus]MBD1838011.1 hypothetical protein [Coleofasciculus sp. FACHB-501]MBD2044072.1 hypothetical protein [Coleofasciculus sp. FACHB-64]